MTAPFITMEAGKVAADVRAIHLRLDAEMEAVLAATSGAMTEVLNDVISDSQQRINNRSGELSRTATVEEVVRSEGQLSLRGGFNSKHGRQTDQGGDIVSSRPGGLLAIPLDPALTGRGVLKAEYAVTGPGGLRNIPGLRLQKSHSGKLFLVKDLGDRTDFLFLLTPRVHQKGTKFFTSVLTERTPTIAPTIAGRIVERLAGGGA